MWAALGFASSITAPVGRIFIGQEGRISSSVADQCTRCRWIDELSELDPCT